MRARKCYQDLPRDTYSPFVARIFSAGVELFLEHALNAIFRLLREKNFMECVFEHSVLVVQPGRHRRQLREHQTDQHSLHERQPRFSRLNNRRLKRIHL